MGLSSSKSKTTTDQKTTETGSTVPVNPPWVTDAIEQYTSRLGAFGDQDPNLFVAGPAPLQQMAWQNAGSLQDWQPQARLASEQALRTAQAGPANAGQARTYVPASGQATAWQAPDLGPAPQAGPAAMQAPTLGPAAQGQAASYRAPQLGPASTYAAPDAGQGALVAARGYSAPQLGASTGYVAPRIGAPIGAQAQTYTTQPTERVQIGPTVNATASNATAESLLPDLARYQNPFNEGVRTAALEDHDLESARIMARQKADAARAGAFGGSRFAIAEAETLGNLNRNRAALDAGLLAEGFDRAAALAEADTGRRQGTSIFNAQNLTGMSSQNAAAENARRMAQAGFGQEASLFDSGARTEAAQFGAGSRERAGFLNTGLDQDRNLAQAAIDAEQARHDADMANRFAEKRADISERAGQLDATLGAQADIANQGSRNDMSRFNATLAAQAAQDAAAARNQYGLAQGQLAADAGKLAAGNQQAMEMFNRDNQNDFAIQQAGMAERAGQLNAGNRQQTSLANLDVLSRYGLAQGQMNADAASQNAAASNTYGLANMDALGRAREFAAAGENQFALANAGFADQGMERSLRAAGLLGDISNQYAGNVRADLGLMGQLGDQQRAIEAQYAMAPLAQLQALGELYGTTPYNLFSGQNVSGSGTMQGTNVTKSAPSLFNQMLAAATVASKFV